MKSTSHPIDAAILAIFHDYAISWIGQDEGSTPNNKFILAAFLAEIKRTIQTELPKSR